MNLYGDRKKEDRLYETKRRDHGSRKSLTEFMVEEFFIFSDRREGLVLNSKNRRIEIL